MKVEQRKLTVEQYLDFFENHPTTYDLTIDQLNQIVVMHGFLKLHRRSKMDIIDMLGSMKLMRPTQSTIRGPAPTASSAALALGEVQEAINVLGWQECPIGSILNVRTAIMESEDEVEAAPPEMTLTSDHLGLLAGAGGAGGAGALEMAGKVPTRKRTRV